MLVLLGGASRGDMMHVSPTQLSVLGWSPRPRAASPTRAGAGWRCSGSSTPSGAGTRGTRRWTTCAGPSTRSSAGRGGKVGLVGHSLGGRAALLSAGLPEVGSVVALNPWLYPSEGVVPTRSPVLVVHGLRDRIAAAARSAAYIQTLNRRGPASYVAVAEGKHAMLRRGGVFDRYAAEFAAATLLSDPPDVSGTVGRGAGRRAVREGVQTPAPADGGSLAGRTPRRGCRRGPRARPARVARRTDAARSISSFSASASRWRSVSSAIRARSRA